MERRLNHVVLAVGMLLLAACCTAQRPDKLPDDAYPGALRAPAALGAEVMWRQKVTAKWGKSNSQSFEAVLQTSGDKLTLLGLSPTGQVGFTIVLQGGEIAFENKSGMDLPFPPRFILLDVQRTFWPWLGAAPAAAGERSGQVEGETVVERYDDGGRLTSREFERISGEPRGRIRVRYSGWKAGERAPAKAVLDNGWFGYVLVVETYEQQLLTPSSAGARVSSGAVAR